VRLNQASAPANSIGVVYLLISIVAVALPHIGTREKRSPAPTWLLAGMVAVWALRLSLFLFARIRRAGKDARFRELKASFPHFLLTWTLQGLWAAVTSAAALAAITAPRGSGLDAWAWAGLVVWLFGFAFEAVADAQKSRFKADPANRDRFIQSGLWSLSRHPNYFGEIVLWIGVALVALPTLAGWRWLTLVSPLFVILLLTRVSGIPMLAARADAKWGGRPGHEAYNARTPVSAGVWGGGRALRSGAPPLGHSVNTEVDNMASLQDKVVVITGSTRGFGNALARLLVAKGAKVVISGRKQETVEGQLLLDINPLFALRILVYSQCQVDEAHSVVVLFEPTHGACPDF
jgi:steroid 5-alpha reductase family enzyme